MAFTFKMRNQTFTAATLAELSALYCKARDDSGEGNSTFPKPSVRKVGGGVIGAFSYNGRIWNNAASPARTIIYDNRVEA
jgi:hypothetical protein